MRGSFFGFFGVLGNFFIQFKKDGNICVDMFHFICFMFLRFCGDQIYILKNNNFTSVFNPADAQVEKVIKSGPSGLIKFKYLVETGIEKDYFCTPLIMTLQKCCKIIIYFSFFANYSIGKTNQ